MEEKTKPYTLTTLLLCPHCGGEPQELQHDCQFWIQCKKCYGVDGQTCVHTSQADAAAAWNKRFACLADSPESWSDAQIIEFLSVALRHVNVSGNLTPQDIRDGFHFMPSKNQRADLALIRGQEPVKSAGEAWLNCQQCAKYGDESEAEEAFLAGYMAALSAKEALNEGR